MLVAQRANAALSRGIEKAALVLLSVSKPVAQDLLKFFTPEELDAIGQSADRLRTMSDEELAAVFAEFERSFNSGVRFVGTPEEIRELIANAVSTLTGLPQVEDGPAIEPPPEEPVWPKLEAMDQEKLVAFIDAQHPQAAAFILSSLKLDVSAPVLGALPAIRRNDLLIRMLDISGLSDAAVDVVKSVVQAELLKKPEADRRATYSSLAGLLNRLDRTQSLEAIEEMLKVRPVDAVAVKKLLFSFEDLVQLPKRSLAMVVDQVPADQLVRAVFGSSEQFLETVLGVLSPRARRMVESELKALGNVTAKDVDAARRDIVSLVLSLVAQGSIELPQAEA
jgi:flagellar motor switch protein FliG